MSVVHHIIKLGAAGIGGALAGLLQALRAMCHVL
jgi:hypothetical protein